MTVLISSIPNLSSPALYADFKALATTHGWWTLVTDSWLSWNAFTLEYTSALTIDWEPITVRLQSNSSQYLTVGVYDSTNTLQSTTYSTWAPLFTLTWCKVYLADDFFVVAPSSWNTSWIAVAAWRLYDVYNSPLTWRDNLGYAIFEAGWGAKWFFKPRSYSTAWTIQTNIELFPLLPNAWSGTAVLITENAFVNSWPSGTEKITLYPITVSLYFNYWILGTLRTDTFFQTAQTTPTTSTVWAEFTINWVTYKRIYNTIGNYMACVAMKW